MKHLWVSLPFLKHMLLAHPNLILSWSIRCFLNDQTKKISKFSNFSSTKDKRKVLHLDEITKQAGISVAGEQSHWKGPRGPGTQEAGHKPVVPCCSKGKSHPGLHPQRHHQRRWRCDHPTQHWSRPHLECCVQSWSPWLRKRQTRLKRVQRGPEGWRTCCVWKN